MKFFSNGCHGSGICIHVALQVFCVNMHSVASVQSWSGSALHVSSVPTVTVAATLLILCRWRLSCIGLPVMVCGDPSPIRKAPQLTLFSWRTFSCRVTSMWTPRASFPLTKKSKRETAMMTITHILLSDCNVSATGALTTHSQWQIAVQPPSKKQAELGTCTFLSMPTQPRREMCTQLLTPSWLAASRCVQNC